jgi:hypothetical protein
MSDSICEPVTTLEEAQVPIVTMLLPVKGLRHTEDGELTPDAVKIITDGMKNLGLSIKDEGSLSIILNEIRQVLCKLNAQYNFLLMTLFGFIDSSETIPKSILDSIREKNLAMRDVLSLSRQILKGSKLNENGIIEGYTNVSNTLNLRNSTLESFEDMTKKLMTDQAAIDKGDYADVKRSFDISVEKIKGVSSNLALYSFLNIVAIGLLFYIVSAK